MLHTSESLHMVKHMPPLYKTTFTWNTYSIYTFLRINNDLAAVTVTFFIFCLYIMQDVDLLHTVCQALWLTHFDMSCFQRLKTFCKIKSFSDVKMLRGFSEMYGFQGRTMYQVVKWVWPVFRRYSKCLAAHINNNLPSQYKCDEHPSLFSSKL